MRRLTHYASTLMALACVVALVSCLLPSQARADSSRILTMGADLTQQQRTEVLDFFGLSEADLAGIPTIIVTNADERAYLEGKVATELIGDRTYSCSYIEATQSGGIFVQTKNLNYVDNMMLYNALQTAGVENVNLVVTAPFSVSGTGALTGVFMALEDMGVGLETQKEQVATTELVETADLAATYGEGVVEVISDVKDQVVSSAQGLSDDEVKSIIRAAASTRGIALSDQDLDRIVAIIHRIMSLDYDRDAFATTINDFKAQLDEVARQAGRARGFLDMLADLFRPITDFFASLLNGGQVPDAPDIPAATREFFENIQLSE